jgi:hypothetical protein
MYPVWRNYNRDRLPDYFVGRVTEEALCAFVPASDDAIEVLAYDRIITRLDNGRKPVKLLLTASRRIVWPRLSCAFVKLMKPGRIFPREIVKGFVERKTAGESEPVPLHVNEIGPQHWVRNRVGSPPGLGSTLVALPNSFALLLKHDTTMLWRRDS